MSRVHVLVSSVFYSYGTCHAHTWPNVLCHTHCILRVCFCVCVCVRVCVACIDSLWVVYEAQMIDGWAPLERFPTGSSRHKRSCHCLLSDLTVCSLKYVGVCVCGGKGVCVCVCKCLRVCRSCHLFPVLSASSVSGRAFDLVDRRFLQCEIAPARFTQWKSRP